MKVGDKVRRKWKPNLGYGIILHKLGDTFVVKWYGKERPLIKFEESKYLSVYGESR